MLFCPCFLNCTSHTGPWRVYFVDLLQDRSGRSWLSPSLSLSYQNMKRKEAGGYQGGTGAVSQWKEANQVRQLETGEEFPENPGKFLRR